MAKEKAVKEEKVEKSKTIKDIEKAYGKIIHSGISILKQKQNLETIHVSPILDLGMGGGIKEGSFVTLIGPPKCGKSTLALQIASSVQNEEKPRKVFFIPSEGRLKEINLTGIKGLNLDLIDFIQSDDKPLSAETILDTIYKLITDPENARAIFIVDSFSSLIPQKEIDEDVGRSGLPRILSGFCKKIGQILPNQKGLIIGILHQIANTSGYGPSKMADSGVKITYQSDTCLECKGIEKWVEGDKQIGQAIDWEVKWSSMGATGVKCRSWLRYGLGIDKTKELLMVALELNIIDQAGAWFTCSYLLNNKEYLVSKGVDPEKAEDCERAVRFQGQEKLYNFIDTDQAAFDLLTKEIRGMLE